MPDRPKDMYRNARPVVPNFDSDEWLYHRIDPCFVEADGTIDAVHITFRFPELSSNRSKFSEPWYVLYPRTTWGSYAVLKFRPQDVPKSVHGDSKDSPEHKIKNEHSPQNDNYGHCETQIYRSGKRLTRTNQLKDSPKAKLRLAFSKIVKLVRKAGEPFPPKGWVDPGQRPHGEAGETSGTQI